MKKHPLLLVILATGLCASVLSAPNEPVLRPSYIHDLGFNREILFQRPSGCVPASEIDEWPAVDAKSGIRFPQELAHTGFVGYIRGVVVFTSDGAVALLAVSYGNSKLLSDAADEYVRGLSFSPPKKGGRPAAVVLRFECFVTEQGTYGPIFEGAGRRPNSESSVSQQPTQDSG